MEASADIDFTRESISDGTMWLPIDIGGFDRSNGPFVKVTAFFQL
jgi:hypothetical protein